MNSAMNARFEMTPESEKFLRPSEEKAEYIVLGPVDIEVVLKSGDVRRPQEVRERIVRCGDCVYCEEGSTGLLECRKLLFAGEYEGDEPIPLGPCPDGFCAWGEERWR